MTEYFSITNVAQLSLKHCSVWSITRNSLWIPQQRTSAALAHMKIFFFTLLGGLHELATREWEWKEDRPRFCIY